MDGKLIHTVKVDGSDRLIGLFKHKTRNKYSFVNITKFRITDCEFDTIEDAMKDLDSYVESGKILAYHILDDNFLKNI